jgi:hypothetical protein
MQPDMTHVSERRRESRMELAQRHPADVVTESVRLVQSKHLRGRVRPTAMRCNMGTRVLRERAYESESESGV